MQHGETQDLEIEPSSGNVFDDLGLPHPEEYKFKSDLVIQIRRCIERREWTQAQAVELIGIDQPTLSKLLRGRLSGFSIDRLLMIVHRLGHHVELRISEEEHSPEEARMLVCVV